MSNVVCKKRLEWDSAHRVLRHESKCASLHGHRYAAVIECRAPRLDSVGRVIDYSVIKARVGAWIDQHWDHTTLVNGEDLELALFVHKQGKRPAYFFAGEPTAENIAIELLGVAQSLLKECGVHVASVEIFETPTSSAIAYANRPSDGGVNFSYT